MTTFSTNTGFNAFSVSTSDEAYFSLQKGFNAFSAGLQTSILIVRFDGLQYALPVDLTFESVEGIYNTAGAVGKTAIYPFYNSSNIIQEMTITATGTGVNGTVTITPTTAGFYFLDLEIEKCIQPDSFNKYNFYEFYQSVFTIGEDCPTVCSSDSLGCDNGYIREKRKAKACLLQGDELSFFLNQETATDLSAYKVAILNTKYDFVAQDLPLSQLDNLDGTFNYYSTFTVPCLPRGVYYLAIYDPATSNCVYISREFKAVNIQNWREQTRLLKYRNGSNIGGFKFEQLPSFYNVVRLDISPQSSTFPSEKVLYREQNTKQFRYIQSTTDKNTTFKCFAFDLDFHQGAVLAFDCDEIYLNGVQYLSPSAYEANIEEVEDISNGIIELIEVGFSFSSENGC